MLKNALHFEELPYQPDSARLFAAVRELPQPLFLDSCHPWSSRGRFDILAADPVRDFSFNLSNSSSYKDIRDFFELLSDEHNRYCNDLVGHPEMLPFCGGLAGCLDYELGRPLQYLPAQPAQAASVYLYDWAVIQDHLRQRTTLVSLPGVSSRRRDDVLSRLKDTPVTSGSAPFSLLGGFLPDLERKDYASAFDRVQSYIHAGDSYQVNLARRFSADFEGDPWLAYQVLRPLAAAPFSGFFDSGDRQLLCLSPERFLRLSGRRVETSPIKGTRPRSDDASVDAAAAAELQASPKDRAENLMIVDLLRNDIGRNCVPGSVQVERLFDLESYPTVHHLVSTISGEISPAADALTLLRDSFPGGSITGAPKRRAMEIIEELESGPRQAYCGSLFYVSADGRMDSNIAIRSLVCERGSIHCWGGGGIVADSECGLEFQESWDKIGRFIDALEAMV